MDPEQMVIWIREQTSWIYFQVYQNQFFFFDLWSLAHLWSGFVFFSILLALKSKSPWLWLITGLILYEVAELLMLYVSLHVFYPETIKDQFTDIFVGILGGYIAYLFAYQQTRKSIQLFHALDFASLLVGITIAFIWVGHSRFFLTQALGSDPFSVWVFFLRLLQVYFLARIYASLRKGYEEIKLRLFLISIAYSLLFILSGILTDLQQLLSGDLGVWSHGTIYSEGGDLFYRFGFLLGMILFYELIHFILAQAAAEFSVKYSEKGVISEVIGETVQQC